MRVLSYEFENHNGLQLIISSNPPIEFTQINQFELNMLKQNQFDYFLPCNVVVIDNAYKFHYHVQSYKKLQYYMQINCLTQVNLYQFTSQLIDAMQKSYSNMLLPDGCIINMDALFYDEQKKRIMLAYLPVQHKENSVYLFLQWFLYWSNQVVIKDYEHLHHMLSTFIAHDFTLERVQQLIFDYLYQDNVGLSDNVALNNGVVHSRKETKEQKLDIEPKPMILNSEIMLDQVAETDLNSRHSKRHIERQTLGIKHEHNIVENDEELPMNTKDASKQSVLLRTILICSIILCAPLAAWYKLYIEQQTIANLWICIGITILTSAVIVLIFAKMFKQKHSGMDLIEEVTADTHPAYRYYEQDKLNIVSKLEQLAMQTEQEKNDNVNNISPVEQLDVSDVNKSLRQLDTVKMSYDDATVHMDHNRLDAVTLIRSYHQVEKQFKFTTNEIVVGRSIEGVHINDEFSGVSRLHIQFEYNKGLVIAKDLGSRNGSYINDKVMTPYKNYVINEEDRIQLINKEGPIYYVKWT